MCQRSKCPCRYLAEVPVDQKLGEPRPSSVTMHVQWVPWDIGKQFGGAIVPLLILHAVGFLSITGSVTWNAMPLQQQQPCSCIMSLTGHK